MNNYNKRKFIQFTSLAASLLSLAVSLTSFAYLSYAWFTAVREAKMKATEFSVDEGLEVSFKYYSDSFDDGGYLNPSLTINPHVLEDYNTDFVEMTQGDIDTFGALLLREPGYRVTFAFETTSLPTSIAHLLSLDVFGFTALNEEGEDYIYDSSLSEPKTSEKITLAPAINIYAAPYYINGSAISITEFAEDFINADSPGAGDTFNGMDQNFNLSSLPLDANADPEKVVFFVTFEFSGNPNSFYRFVLEENGKRYYEADPLLGNSNVYQNLNFKVNTLSFRKIY